MAQAASKWRLACARSSQTAAAVAAAAAAGAALELGLLAISELGILFSLHWAGLTVAALSSA